MAIQYSHEIHHRDDFALLCNWRKLWRVVEVGVEKGEFANCFLSRWLGVHSGGLYIGVDDWRPYEGMQWDRDGDYMMACIRFERYARVAKIIKGESVGTAKTLLETPSDYVGKPEFDFIYIDAAHDYESVMADLSSWWPLVREGGILAGHDFDETHLGVMKAVSKFFLARLSPPVAETIYLTHEEFAPSWYVYKGGIPGPEWKRC